MTKPNKHGACFAASAPSWGQLGFVPSSKQTILIAVVCNQGICHFVWSNMRYKRATSVWDGATRLLNFIFPNSVCWRKPAINEPISCKARLRLYTTIQNAVAYRQCSILGDLQEPACREGAANHTKKNPEIRVEKQTENTTSAKMFIN